MISNVNGNSKLCRARNTSGFAAFLYYILALKEVTDDFGK
jgi:hypothetical protein